MSIGFIYGQPQYQVTASLVLAHLVTGQQVHVYQHAFLPTGTDPLQIAQLLQDGQIRAVEETA